LCSPTARDKSKGAITSEIKHAIKLKTSPARLAQLLHNGRYAVIGCKLMLMRAATVVQVMQDWFHVLLRYILPVIAHYGESRKLH